MRTVVSPVGSNWGSIGRGILARVVQYLNSDQVNPAASALAAKVDFSTSGVPS